MKVIVCGGRDYQDRYALFAAMDAAHAKKPIAMVIHGGARGADTMAGEWAEARGIFSARVDALWDAHGKAAGPAQPGDAVAVPGGADRLPWRAWHCRHGGRCSGGWG